MAAIGEVVINFRPRGVEAAARKFNSHTPPVRNPSGLSRRERILALYRQQGRPQAHLDRVMKLGMGSLEEVRKKWEDRFREGSMRSNIKRYGSNGPPPPCRPPPPANPPRKPA